MRLARSFSFLILMALALAAAASAQFLTPSPLPNGVLNIPYNLTILTSGPLINWTISKGALPPGLGIDGNGNIIGVPTATGTFGFIVSAQDPSTLLASTQPYLLTIEPPLAIGSPLTLPPVTAGGTYSFHFQAINGTAPYSWTLDTPTLPPGLTLDVAGVLSGMPTKPGSYSMPMTVTDASVPVIQNAHATFILVVNPPVSGGGTLPNGFVGQAYAQALPVSGGTSPFAFTLSGGTVPPGLSLSPDGTLSGVPLRPGTYQLALVVRDAYGVLGGAAYTVNILAAGVSIVTQSLPDGTVGQAYAQTLTAIGGKAPYLWSAGGPLPAGLTLDPAGSINGTPTAAGEYGFTLRVSDAGDSSDSRDFSITVAVGPPAIVTASLPNGTVSVPYAQTLTAAGGRAPYSWNVEAG